MRKRKHALTLLIILAIMLTGCGDGEFYVSESKDASIEVSSDATVEASEDISNEDEKSSEDNIGKETVAVSVTDLEETAIDPATGAEELEKEEVNEQSAEELEEDIYDGPVFSFATTDLAGNEVSSESLSDKKLIMLNFFESWCGPCVREMPELEKLYQDYEDEGFIIIGAYSIYSDPGEIKAVVKKTGVTYPIIEATDEMYDLMTEYVPTTVFLDGKGRILTDEPYVGSNDYSGWENVIKFYLE